MSIYKIDINSTVEEIKDFYYLYVESFPDLCVNKGTTIIDLGEYIKPSKNINIFIDDVIFVVKGLGYIIYYTHNDDVITSISIIEVEELIKCYVTLRYLCGNQSTQHEKINGMSQGRYMLNFVFNTYGDNIILIEPATPELVPYYTSYKKPSFPYDNDWLKETHNYLIYGNLYKLNEDCFSKLFTSIGTIKQMEKMLQFNSLNDLYSNVNNLNSLKEKLISKLDFLVKTKQLNATYYEQLLDKIIHIKFFDIQEIIIYANKFERGILERRKMQQQRPVSGGRKKKITYKKKCKNSKRNKNKCNKKYKTLRHKI